MTTIFYSGNTYSYVKPRPSMPNIMIPKSTRGSNDLLNLVIIAASSGVVNMPPISLPNKPVSKTIRFSDDSIILAMSDEEYLKSIKALSGKLADDENMSDSWLESIRNEWDERLEDLYGIPETPTNSHI